MNGLSYEPQKYISLLKRDFEQRLEPKILSDLELCLCAVETSIGANRILCAAELMANDHKYSKTSRSIDQYIRELRGSKKISIYYGDEHETVREAILYIQQEANMSDAEFSQVTGITFMAVKNLTTSRKISVKLNLIHKVLAAFELYPADASGRLLDLSRT